MQRGLIYTVFRLNSFFRFFRKQIKHSILVRFYMLVRFCINTSINTSICIYTYTQTHTQMLGLGHINTSICIYTFYINKCSIQSHKWIDTSYING